MRVKTSDAQRSQSSGREISTTKSPHLCLCYFLLSCQKVFVVLSIAKNDALQTKQLLFCICKTVNYLSPLKAHGRS